MKRPLRSACIALAALALPAAHAARIDFEPVLPGHGVPVVVQLTGTDWPPYIPATRYSVSGNRVTLDYEYASDNFAAARSDFGDRAVKVGELPAGNYVVEARLHDFARPGSAPQVVTQGLAVAPPQEWGLYTVPRAPAPHEAAWVMIRSAAYFDPASMRATVQGNVVRVDFTYAPDAPTGGENVPAGYSSFGAVRIPGLAPGSWRVEGWGRSRVDGATGHFFTREVVVGGPSWVVEYYAPSLDHYFITAGPGEVAQLDGNPSAGWLRTGERFRAWLSASEAPAGARPVCRFYASGPNSHFYTADEGECAYLRRLEGERRAAASTKGLPFTEWQYEGIAFHALVPVGGQCPAGSDPVWRAYNGREADNDANHRFVTDAQLRSAMGWTWRDEGVAFCSPR